MFRLVKYLSQDHLLGNKRPVKFVVDAGTGTTSMGGLAAMSLRLVLPWEINAVMLADTLENYKRHEDRLIAEFRSQFLAPSFCSSLDMIKWVDRKQPRKYTDLCFHSKLESLFKLPNNDCDRGRRRK